MISDVSTILSDTSNTNIAKLKRGFVVKPFNSSEIYDLSRLNYKQPKLTITGMKNVAILYETEPFIIQTPRMLSFGINKWTSPEGNSSNSITFSFLNIEKDSKLQKFHKFLEELDYWALTEIQKKSWEWLSIKSISLEEIQANYYKVLRSSANNHPDYIKIKLRNSTSGYSTTFFNKEKEQIEYSNIDEVFTKGSFVRGLLQCVGLWFADGKFGLSWKLIQLLVESRSRIKPNFNECLIEESND